MTDSTDPRLPNIVLILADNLGWGELGCYGGGALRGAPTPRIDRLASEGLRFLNFNVESDCVPTRSALMTGRHPIRTGGLQSVPAGLPQGIHPWEITLAQLISGRGYATAMFGKWHLGDREGRYPKDRGFDQWYGIPRTTNESMFTSSPGFDPSVVEIPHVMEGCSGEPARNVEVYDLEMRRRIDAELVARSNDFMRRQSKRKKPFFLYVPLTQLHYPTIPHRDFIGKTGWGEFADSMAEMDHRVGQILDEIVHVTDLYPTLARVVGARAPTDRPIDGVDQLDFFLGRQSKSNREGFVYYIKNEMRAVKWRQWKMHLVWETEPNVGPIRLETPWIFNLIQDPKEESDIGYQNANWVRGPMLRLIRNFQESLKQHPPIPPGAPDDFVPY